MKAGIVTFQRVNNYGTVLQMYALYKTIKNMGADCDVIDYKRNNIGDVIVWQKNKIRSFLQGHPDRQLYGTLEFAKLMVLEVFLNSFARKKFDDFRRMISFSRIVDKNTIRQSGIEQEYDLFISGSDQVWNCGRVNLDAAYMLDFVTDPRKKTSYAASFGFRRIPQKYEEIYKRVLSDYRKVSIRERDGIEIFRELTGREDAQLVLDPSMLLDKKEWKKIAVMSPVKKDYVFVYQLGSSKRLLDFAEKLAKEHDCKLLVLPHAFGSHVKASWCLGKGPQEWLGLFLGAKYIVTNSFHGTAFSINLNKEFYVEVSKERSRSAVQSRVYHLLHLFHLEDRLITDSLDIRYMEKIDYRKVNRSLDVLREQSLNCLRDILKSGE